MKRHLYLTYWSEEFLKATKNTSVEDIELGNEFVPKKISGAPSWKTKGSVPVNKAIRDAINNKKRLHRRWISSLYRSDNNTSRQEY